MIISW